MALFDDYSSLSPAQQTVLMLKQMLNQGKQQNRMLLARAAQLLWQNPQVSPPEVLQELGTDAGQLFTVFDQLVALLNATGDHITQLVPPGWSYTLNADGSAAVTKAPENPQPTSTPEAARIAQGQGTTM